MNYPDGTTVNLGDHIWWNEGNSIGFVRIIIDGKNDEKIWGFDEPHILISGYHPKDPTDAGYVAYPPSNFADEGIERLTPEEEEQLACAIAEVSTQSGYREPFLIDVISRDGRAREITFSTFDGGKTEEFGRVTLSEKGLWNKAADDIVPVGIGA